MPPKTKVDLNLDELLGAGQTFQLGGKTYHLPGEIDVDVILRAAELDAVRLAPDPVEPEPPTFEATVPTAKRRRAVDEYERAHARWREEKAAADAAENEALAGMRDLVLDIIRSVPGQENARPTPLGQVSVTYIFGLAAGAPGETLQSALAEQVTGKTSEERAADAASAKKNGKAAGDPTPAARRRSTSRSPARSSA